jgi:hypothetical protein
MKRFYEQRASGIFHLPLFCDIFRFMYRQSTLQNLSAKNAEVDFLRCTPLL